MIMPSGNNRTGSMTPRKQIFLLCLVSIILVSFVLRAYRLDWGLPMIRHHRLASTYNPDEATYLKAFLNMHESQSLNPGAYNVGGNLAVYLFAAGAMIGKTLQGHRFVDDEDYYREHPCELASIYLSCRLTAVFFSVLLVAMTVILGASLYGKISGIFAGVLAAFTPELVVQARFIKAGQTATFFGLIFLFLLHRFMDSDRLFHVNLAFIALGAAIATKINMLIFGAAYVYVLWSKMKGHRVGFSIIKHLILIPVLLCLLTFAACNPSMFTHGSDFARSILFVIYGQRQPVLDTIGIHNLWMHYLHPVMTHCLGMPLFVAVLAGVSGALWRLKREDKLLLFVIIPYFLFLGIGRFAFARYLIPIIPLLIILTARIFKRGDRYNLPGILCFGLLGLAVVIYCFSSLAMLASDDPRELANEWMESNIPRSATLGMLGEVYFYAPPLLWQDYRELGLYDYVMLDYNLSLLKRIKPQFIIMTDAEYRHYYRASELFPGKYAFLEAIRNSRDYELVARFDNPPALFGIEVNEGYAPHDWKYTHPVIEIYRRLD